MGPGQPTTFTYILLAEALRYPAPGRLQNLVAGLADFPSDSAKASLEGFLNKIDCLSLTEWEELYTRTLDLNPLAAPYIGFQVWGESYQRGVFLSKMAREMATTGVDLEGELPDHLIPVLRYLAMTSLPIPELVEVIDPALRRMLAVLRKAEPENPYIDLLEAVKESCKSLDEEAV